MGPRHKSEKRIKKVIRSIAPATLLFTFTAVSTGTVLASDNCRVTLVQTFTSASNTADRHVTSAHKHTKATLAAWQVWGNAYLAKHGHPFVPPKRIQTSLHPVSPKEQDRLFKFACESLPIPTVDLPVLTMLVPEEEDIPPYLPMLAPGLDTPGPVVPTTVAEVMTPTTIYPFQPVFLPPGGFGGGGSTGGVPTTPGSPSTPDVPVTPPDVPVTPPTDTPTPPVLPPDFPPTLPPVIPPDVPPVVVTPEPGSFLLLGTGLAAMVGVLKRRSRA